jgi:hypothetical protein
MSRYKVRVMKPSFKERVDAYITSKTFGETNELVRNMEAMRVRENLNHFWNHKEEFSEQKRSYFEDMGIGTPEYTEIVVESAEKGFQSQPRIEWDGKIKKINEIDDIFYFIACM